MDRNLRIVGTGLDHDVAAADLLAKTISGETRKRLQQVWLSGFQSETLLASYGLEETGPESDRQRQLRGREAERLARVFGWGRTRSGHRTELADLISGGKLARRLGPVLE